MSSPPAFTKVKGISSSRATRFGLLLLDVVSTEVEAEGPHLHAGLPEPGGHAGGVEAAREEQPDLALVGQASGDRLPAAATKGADGGLAVVKLSVDLLLQREIGRAVEPTILPGQEGAGEEAPDAAHRGLFAGHEGEGQVPVQGHGVHRDRQSRDGQELFQLAGEVEDAGVLDVVQRADPEGIAEEAKAPTMPVPRSAGEGAIQVLQAPAAGIEATPERGGGRRHGRGERPGTGRAVGAIAVDARRLARPAAPPAVAEAHPRPVGDVRVVAAVIDGRQHDVQERGVRPPHVTTDAAQARAPQSRTSNVVAWSTRPSSDRRTVQVPVGELGPSRRRAWVGQVGLSMARVL